MSHDKLAGFENALESRSEFGFERVVLGVDVEERDHGLARWGCDRLGGM